MEHEERLKAALADRYAIEREIGSGGMATVYLAQDLKHDRQVAVKVLKSELAAVLGAERFLNEIKVTANLQHPHILPLFDSGEADGMLFYVMPFVDGETLRDRLNREKQLPVEEALQLATEVANALDYAHRHEVIHRDIKPGNILLQDGQALVADFGIALAVTAAGGNRVTETGLSLGTPEYMSPEQASADRELDARSDVYSLGAVLYEMLAGEPPHRGPTVQAVLSRALTEEVEPVTSRRSTVPAHVDGALRVALQKVAADRFQSAQSFAAALAGALVLSPEMERRSPSARAEIPGHNSFRSGRAVAAAVSLLLLGGAAGWFAHQTSFRRAQTVPVTSFTVPIPGGIYLGQQPEMALSPDGETLVLCTDGPLRVRRLSEFESFPIPGTEGADNPFFSPDGRFVGFVQERTLRKVSLDGGPVADIAALPEGWLQGADWGEDGNLVLSGIGGVRRVPAGGGDLEVITRVDSASEHMHMWPQSLEGGRVILFTSMGPSAQWEDAKIVIKDLESERQKVVAERGTFGRYLPTGHIIFASENGTISAVPFDLDTWELRGDPVPVEPGVHVAAWGGGPQFAYSPGGTAAFIRASVWEDNLLLEADRTGEQRQLIDPLKAYYLEISPDGSRAAVSISRPGETDIHVLDPATGNLEHLTFGTPFDDTAVWSPDGSRIAFSADWVNGASQILIKASDPAASPEVMFTGEYHIHLTDWSPDGQWIAFYYVTPDLQQDVYVVQVDSVDNVLPVVSSPGSEMDGQFSPDGRWLAYEGDGEVYVTPFPPTGGMHQVSLAGGTSPRWARNAGELAFWKGDTLMVTQVSTEPTFNRTTPRPLLSVPGGTRRYDMSPDGGRFILATRNPESRISEIHVVRNWFEVLKERVGG